MNKRIHLLAEQAYGTQATEQEIKFAELIVKECLNIIQYEANGYAEPVWAYEIVNDIKERFDMASHLE